jgi:hypothetical protein
MLGMTDLATALQTYCSSWMDLYQLRMLQDDMNALAAELMNEHLYLYVDANVARATDRKGSVRTSIWSASWWRALFSFGQSDNSDGASDRTDESSVLGNGASSYLDTSSNTKTTSATPQYGAVARQQFDDREHARVLKQFDRAFSILQRWCNVCTILAANRERAMCTQIFQCAWKSGLDQQDYSDTALPLHTVMWAVTCASLSFNVGRRCEVLKGDAYKAHYENAFRLLYHVAYNELCTWTNNDSLDTSECPPEARLETCTAYMRMCLMKLQICTIQHVEFRTIGAQQYDSNETHLTSARNMYRLALYLEYQVTSMMPAEHTFVNTTYRAPSLYQPGSYVILSMARVAEYYALVAKAYQSLACLHFYHLKDIPPTDESDVRTTALIQHRACAVAAVECVDTCKLIVKLIDSGIGDSGMARIVFDQFWIPYVFRYWLLVVRPKFDQARGDLWTFPTSDDSIANTNNVGADEITALATKFEASIAIAMRDTATVSTITPPAVSAEPCMYLNSADTVYDRLFSLRNGLLQPITSKK